MGIVYISGLESHLPLHKTTQIMDLTEGPVSRHLLRLALPMIIAFIFVTSYNFIDRLFVSALGDIAIAAVGMAFTLQMVIYSIGSGIGAGINELGLMPRFLDLVDVDFFLGRTSCGKSNKDAREKRFG